MTLPPLLLALPLLAASPAEDFVRALAIGEEVCARFSHGDVRGPASFMVPEPEPTIFSKLELDPRPKDCSVTSKRLSEEDRALSLRLLHEDGATQDVTLEFEPLGGWRFGSIKAVKIAARKKPAPGKKPKKSYVTGFEDAMRVQAEMDDSPRGTALRRIEDQVAAERKRRAP
jgi:hypothetical protein